FRDATVRLQAQADRREADRRLQRAERLQSLGVLAGGLAHDLNNILTAILGNLWLCRQGEGGQSETALLEIEHHAHAAADLCSRLLAGAGSAPTLPIAVDVEVAIDYVLHRERRLLPPGLEVERTDREQKLAVMADIVQFRQVVQNLVRNAIEAMVGRVGSIGVECARVCLPAAGVGGNAAALPVGDYVRIVVSDQGPGIPPDVLPRLFEPFFTTKFTGRGLGLASVHGIVRRHCGAIDVETGVGVGSRFVVHWPATTWLGVVATADHGPVPRAGKPDLAGSVLVVDDDVAVLQVTARLLRADGWTCHEASDSAQAVALLEGGLQVDGIVLDVMMPGVGGLELRETIRRLRPGLPVLLVTGMMPDDGGGAASSPDDVLLKPFPREALFARVRAWLRRE
ncbi:MAG: response regulator, partial [Planctomycetes bacterium]|nr:response regulator [Planctomycetota bacterium]